MQSENVLTVVLDFGSGISPGERRSNGRDGDVEIAEQQLIVGPDLTLCGRQCQMEFPYLPRPYTPRSKMEGGVTSVKKGFVPIHMGLDRR